MPRLIKSLVNKSDIIVQYSQAPFFGDRYGMSYVVPNEDKYVGMVFINPKSTKKQRLRLLVHEVAHLAYPQLSELQIINGTCMIAEVLWKEGYRKVKKPKK